MAEQDRLETGLARPEEVERVKQIDLSHPDVLVVIPTIPGREDLLKRSVASIREDMEQVVVVGSIEVDTDGKGPSVTRNRAVVRTLEAGVRPTWIAFLDDDDEFYPDHLSKCVAHAEETGADVVYPWFDLNVGGRIDNSRDPLLNSGQPAFGAPFSGEALTANNYIPVTALVRTSLFIEVGGFPEPNTEAWPHPDCEDWGLWLRLRDSGAKFSHLPERTWTWRWHGKNTSGRPDRAASIYGSKA